MIRAARIAALSAALSCVVAVAATPDGNPKWKGVLDPIGPFQVRDLTGRQFTERDFVGRVLIVKMWSAHCAPCVEEFSEVQKFYESMRDDSSVGFVSLNVDFDSPELKKFLHDFSEEYSFPVLLGWSYFKIGRVPYTWIVDKEGFIRDAYAGTSPGWPAEALASAEAVRRKLPVSLLPPEVREERRRLNEKEGAKAVQLTK